MIWQPVHRTFQLSYEISDELYIPCPWYFIHSYSLPKPIATTTTVKAVLSCCIRKSGERLVSLWIQFLRWKLSNLSTRLINDPGLSSGGVPQLDERLDGGGQASPYVIRECDIYHQRDKLVTKFIGILGVMERNLGKRISVNSKGEAHLKPDTWDREV